MKVIEILKLGRNMAKTLQDFCINLSDFEHIGMYDEYIDMLESGLKKCYIVAFLSEKYKISERKVYYLIKKFSKDCELGAAG